MIKTMGGEKKSQSSRPNKRCQLCRDITFNLSWAVTETFVLTPYDLITEEKYYLE